MTLAILDMPENPAELRSWLEQELIGLRLRQIVTELMAFAGDEPENSSTSLDAICGEQVPVALERGLSALSDEQLRKLLTHPRALFELQTRILLDGKEFWKTRRGPELKQAVRDQWSMIDAAVKQPVPDVTVAAESASVPYTRPHRLRTGWLGLAGALAATLLLGFYIIQTRSGSQTAETEWGWGRSGALAVEMPKAAYLNHLADVAGEWNGVRPESKESLVRRLAEFRVNCNALINAPHPSLAAEDRDWLIERCRAWAAKIDQQLSDLQAGKKNLAEVQAEADATVDKLIAALRDRAKTA